jgi:hypothetical protein
VGGALDRSADAPVLVAPVLAVLGGAREVEVEVRRHPCGARRSSEDDTQDVGVLVAVDERAEPEQVLDGLRREPLGDIRAWRAGLPLPALQSRERVAHLALHDEQVVAARLDPHQQAVEGGDVRAGRVEAALEPLYQRRPRAREWVEHAAARRQVASKERLDELRDELAQVRMQPVDVLRPLPLGQVLLRPGELEVDLAVERVLGSGHETEFHEAAPTPSRRKESGALNPRTE